MVPVMLTCTSCLLWVESFISIITLNLHCHLARQVVSLIPSDRQETKLREFQYLAQGHTARKGRN